MIQLGYWLSREEHAPNDLVRYAQAAEEAGFTFALISDHVHPGLGPRYAFPCPFMWNVIGGIAYATRQLRLGTVLTRSTQNLNPTMIVEAAATAAAMMPGRFFLGVGLSELGYPTPPSLHNPRNGNGREMLAEVIEVIRLSWHGGSARTVPASHSAQREAETHFYRLPAELPPLLVAANSQHSAELAGRLGDGLIAVNPAPDLVKSFERGGAGKPRYGKLNICWARDEAEARRTAERMWPTDRLQGQALQVICGPDPRCCLAEIRRLADLGYDHLSLHQLGPDQDGFFRFCEREILPEIQEIRQLEQFDWALV